MVSALRSITGLVLLDTGETLVLLVYPKRYSLITGACGKDSMAFHAFGQRRKTGTTGCIGKPFGVQ